MRTRDWDAEARDLCHNLSNIFVANSQDRNFQSHRNQEQSTYQDNLQGLWSRTKVHFWGAMGHTLSELQSLCNAETLLPVSPELRSFCLVEAHPLSPHKVEVKAVNLHSMYGFSQIPEDSSRGTTRRYRTRPPHQQFRTSRRLIFCCKLHVQVIPATSNE